MEINFEISNKVHSISRNIHLNIKSSKLIIKDKSNKKDEMIISQFLLSKNGVKLKFNNILNVGTGYLTKERGEINKPPLLKTTGNENLVDIKLDLGNIDNIEFGTNSKKYYSKRQEYKY